MLFVMITTVTQHFLHRHSVVRLGLASDAETSDSHSAPNLGCKVDGPTTPSQTV